MCICTLRYCKCDRHIADTIYGIYYIFSNLILRIIGIDPGKMETNVTEEEIINMVNEGHEQGILEEREAEMISIYLNWTIRQQAIS